MQYFLHFKLKIQNTWQHKIYCSCWRNLNLTQLYSILHNTIYRQIHVVAVQKLYWFSVLRSTTVHGSLKYWRHLIETLLNKLNNSSVWLTDSCALVSLAVLQAKSTKSSRNTMLVVATVDVCKAEMSYVHIIVEQWFSIYSVDFVNAEKTCDSVEIGTWIPAFALWKTPCYYGLSSICGLYSCGNHCHAGYMGAV